MTRSDLDRFQTLALLNLVEQSYQLVNEMGAGILRDIVEESKDIAIELLSDRGIALELSDEYTCFEEVIDEAIGIEKERQRDAEAVKALASKPINNGVIGRLLDALN